jgi:predicted short-subunit dehydrogenase-like oxidoreductase (DUF2520 family)
MPALRVVGPGRAGTAFARAVATLDGWTVTEPRRHGEDLADAARGVDLLVLATPDDVVVEVAAAVAPVDTTVVAHLAGSLGLDVLAPHARRASIHPLRSITEIGADLRGAWFAVAGDHLAGELVDALEGQRVTVGDADRVAYHAAACIASNHLVALLGQVERVAADAGVPLEAYFDLVRQTVDNVASLGAVDALTGPVRRGDEATVARHLEAIDPGERPAYEALANAARRLVPVS